MTKTTRARYTLEFKLEAVRLVEGGQSIAAAARTLGVVEQTLFNWVKAKKLGKLKGADSKPVVRVHGVQPLPTRHFQATSVAATSSNRCEPLI